MTRDMPTPGIAAVAALVYDHSGIARLSIDAKGPRELMNVDDKPEIVSILMEFIRSLSHDLGKVEPSNKPVKHVVAVISTFSLTV